MFLNVRSVASIMRVNLVPVLFELTLERDTHMHIHAHAYTHICACICIHAYTHICVFDDHAAIFLFSSS